MKTDLTGYSENELSLNVLNDEGLYLIRHKPELKEMLNTLFIYTNKQMEVLEQDLKDDLEELAYYEKV